MGKVIKQSDSVTHVDYSNQLALRAFFDRYLDIYHADNAKTQNGFQRTDNALGVLSGIKNTAIILLGENNDMARYMSEEIEKLIGGN